MRGTEYLLTATVLVLVIGCGAPPQPAPAAATDGAAAGTTGSPADPAADPAPTEETGPGARRTHLCQRPLEGSGEVWPRIEALRVLPRDELEQQCGLALVESMSRWRGLPVDLLGPIVAHAAQDRDALVAWVKSAQPRAAAQVVALDVATRWEIGGDPAAVATGIDGWTAALGEGAAPEIAVALAEAGKLAPLLERITEIHKLRCLLEVNALGFAVECKPIHKQGVPITLSWRTATRDGLIEQLELKECKGKSCKKLKQTAAKLLKQYLALVAEIDKELKVEVYQEQLKAWLVLPPFRSN